MVPKKFRGIFVETVLKAPRRSDTKGTAPDKAGAPKPISYICKGTPAKNEPNKPCGAALRAWEDPPMHWVAHPRWRYYHRTNHEPLNRAYISIPKMAPSRQRQCSQSEIVKDILEEHAKVGGAFTGWLQAKCFIPAPQYNDNIWASPSPLQPLQSALKWQKQGGPENPKAWRHTARLLILWCGQLCSARNRRKICTEASCALTVSGATIHHSMLCQLRLHSSSRFFC